jgi:hypothetical protein
MHPHLEFPAILGLFVTLRPYHCVCPLIDNIPDRGLNV